MTPSTLAAPFIVEAGAEDVLTERGGHCSDSRLSRAAGRVERAESIGRAAEIDVEVFGFD